MPKVDKANVEITAKCCQSKSKNRFHSVITSLLTIWESRIWLRNVDTLLNLKQSIKSVCYFIMHRLLMASFVCSVSFYLLGWFWTAYRYWSWRAFLCDQTTILSFWFFLFFNLVQNKWHSFFVHFILVINWISFGI